MAEEYDIEVKELYRSYGDLDVLTDINLKIPRGNIVAIVGGSGSGKSVLMRQMIGLEQPSSGEVYIKGKNFTEADDEERFDILRRFGVMFQSGGLFASMTIGENIRLVLDQYTELSEQAMDDIIEIKLNSVGLKGFKNYLPSEISGGMKKRAAIARAMTLDAEILFFDEPGSGLDPVTSASIDKLIKNINSSLKTTMVLITHDLPSVLSIADQVIMLDISQKGIIAKGTPEEMLHHDNKTVYNFFNRIAE